MSLRQIAGELGCALSTASLWTRGVLPPPVPRVVGASDPPPSRRLVVWASRATKRCPRCGLTLPVETFGRVKHGRQGWCRACFRHHARTRGAAHRAQVDAAAARRREVARRWALDHLRRNPCVDCGEADIVVLEFDHVGEKTLELSVMVSQGYRLERIVAEAAACEVVCANCHRRRTARRAGWARTTDDWRARLVGDGTQRKRNVARVYDDLEARGCLDCGERDLVVLDHDHRGGKLVCVGRMAREGASLARIDAEIAKCDVRCANCHRRRTSATLGYWRSLVTDGVTGPPRPRRPTRVRHDARAPVAQW